MNHCSHPYLFNVSQHACRLFVSSLSRCPVSYLLSPHLTHYDHPSLLHPISKRNIMPISASSADLCTPSDRFKVHRLP